MTAQNNNLKNILLIGGSSLITGLINYAYHPLMLRFLSLEEFWEFASLLGIMNILGIFLVGISLFLNKEVAKIKDEKDEIALLFFESIKYLWILGIFLFFIYLFLSPFISQFLHIHIGLVCLAGMTLLLSCVGTANDGVLRGLKQFRFLSLMSILGALTKLIVWVTLVYFSFQNYGALGGVILSSTLGFLLSTFWVLRIIKSKKIKQTHTQNLLWDFWNQKKEIGNFVLVSFFFAFFFNIDVIFAKHLFSEEVAGIYAGISVLGKFLVFLLLSIETVYYSEITSQSKENVALHHIKNPIFWIILTSLLAIVVNYFIGNFLLEILKPELAGNLGLYLLLLIYYSFLILISFFSKILVSWGYYSTNIILGVFAFILTFLVFIFGKESIESFILIFIGVGGFLTLILGWIFWKNYSQKIPKSIK